MMPASFDFSAVDESRLVKRDGVPSEPSGPTGLVLPAVAKRDVDGPQSLRGRWS